MKRFSKNNNFQTKTRLNVIRPFDPWKSELCNCGKKYSLNPYTGCSHHCQYCYATYIPRFFNIRLKKDLFKKLEKDLQKINGLISMSNSSDPYPSIERKMLITRKCLELMKEYDSRLLIVTKGDTVVRDIDIISQMKCAVSISINTLKKNIFELNAPPPDVRINALNRIKDAGIPVILRLDPILPFQIDDAISVLEKCKFVDHVVSSTLKLKPDSFQRIINTQAQEQAHIHTNAHNTHQVHEGSYRELYIIKGEKIQNSYYLPKKFRAEILERVASKCKELGLSFAFCREGFPFDAKSCDGSHLVPQ